MVSKNKIVDKLDEGIDEGIDEDMDEDMDEEFEEEFDEDFGENFYEEYDDDLADDDYIYFDENEDDENGYNEVEIVCPKCSPKFPIWHNVLKPGQNPVAKCLDCGAIHSFVFKTPKMKSLKIIISRGENSFVTNALFDEDELISVKKEKIIDDENGDIYPVIISSIEKDDKRLPSAKAANIDTIWARAIDHVVVNVSLRKRGTIDTFQFKASGNDEYVVGEPITVGGKTYPIHSIKVRGGRFWRKAGDVVAAKKIQRIYVEEKKPLPNRRGGSSGRQFKKSFHDNDWKSSNFKKDKTTIPKRKK